MTNQVRDSYDALAKIYTDLALNDLDRVTTDRELLASFATLASTNEGTVADLGCGPGHVVDHLSSLGLSTVGYDISPALIAEARHAFPDAQFFLGDLAALDVAESSLAGIVSRYSLIHIVPTSLSQIFESWYRLLQPGAPLLVSFFAASSSDGHGTPFDHAVLTAYQMFPATIAAQLQNAGFDDTNITIRRPLEGERSLEHGTVLTRKPATVN